MNKTIQTDTYLLPRTLFDFKGLSMTINISAWRQAHSKDFEYYTLLSEDIRFKLNRETGGLYPIEPHSIQILLEGKITHNDFEKAITKQIIEMDKQFIENFKGEVLLTEEKKQIKRVKIPGYIYVLKTNRYCKIGKTINLIQRLEKYVTENPQGFKVMYQYKVKDYDREEERVLKMVKKKHHRGEWFKLTEIDLVRIKTHLEAKSIR